MAKLNAMELEHQKDRKEIKLLTTEVTSLRKENALLRETVGKLQTENAALIEKCEKLEKENHLLRDDNERMKRTLGNDCSNSSTPPSAEPPWKAPNMYNGRKTTKRKQGAQPGHKGSCLSKSDVEKKIANGDFVHRIEDIGDTSELYVTRYVLDLKIQAVAAEIRIHAGEEGKYEIPENLRSRVVYGDTVKAICAYLYGEGVVLYCCSGKKDLDTLSGFPILNQFSGTFCHDHETALYHFGTGHAECNVHLCRYLRKNTEETGNPWSHKMEGFLNGMNLMRKGRKEAGETGIPVDQLEGYSMRYDEIVAEGRSQNNIMNML